MKKNKFGVVLKEKIAIDGRKKAICICPICDNEYITFLSDYYGRSKHCGCIKHNMRKTRLYSIWTNMKTRCYNQNAPTYSMYGSKGIIICDEWLNDFNNFKKWSFDNGYNDELTLDRINFKGNYEPNNCRWATYSVQSRNKSNNINIKLDNETKCLKDWCFEYNIDYKNVNRYCKTHNITPEQLIKLKKGDNVNE